MQIQKVDATSTKPSWLHLSLSLSLSLLVALFAIVIIVLLCCFPLRYSIKLHSDSAVMVKMHMARLSGMKQLKLMNDICARMVKLVHKNERNMPYHLSACFKEPANMSVNL